MQRKKWAVNCVFAVASIAFCSSRAHATGASGLPWDTPLLTVSDALWGTPAHAIITAVIVFAGLAWAFTDHQIGARRVFAGAMGGALAINAPDVMTALGWSASVF